MLSRFTAFLAAAFCVAVVGLAAPAAAQQISPAEQDELNRRLNLLESELSNIRGRLGGGSLGGSAGLQATPGDFSSEILLRVNRMEAEMQRLTGAIETLQFQQRRSSDDARNRFGDIEYRLTVLEGGDPSTLGSGNSSNNTGLAPGPQTLGEVPANAVGLTPSQVGSRQAYDEALTLLQSGAFQDAQAQFNEFLLAYPDSPLVGAATFWLGETHFISGDYQNAARVFLESFSDHPNSEKAADSLLKLGMSLGQLGQDREACLTLGEVGQRYPSAGDAVLRKARAERQRLGCS